MVKLLLISNNEDTKSEVEKLSIIHSYEIQICSNQDEIQEIINRDGADIILFDSRMNEIINILRKVKLLMQSKDMRSIALIESVNPDFNILKYTNSYVQMPIDERFFTSAINSAIQLRETFKVLSKNNNDLAKSLYQLNVLYTTSTQLAGSLDKTKLIEIMTDGLEQSLSLSLSYALILNEVNDIKLIIKSLFPISQRLENAIKLIKKAMYIKEIANSLLEDFSISRINMVNMI